MFNPIAPILILTVVLCPLPAMSAGTDLADIHKKALEEYKSGNALSAFNAVRILEQSGIKDILSDKPDHLSLPAYAGILNDYGYLLSILGRIDQSEPILEKVIKLAPQRSVAYLNLGDVLKAKLSRLGEKEKYEATRKVISYYTQYQNLSGKSPQAIKEFLSFNLLNQPSFKDVCEYVAEYHKRNRLIEIVLEGTAEIDVDGDGRADKVAIVTESGTMAVQDWGATDADGRRISIKPYFEEFNDRDWGYDLTMVPFKGRIYFAYSAGAKLNGITEVSDNAENVACAFGHRLVKNLKQSSSKKICQAALRDEFNYIEKSSESHSLMVVPKFMSENTPEQGVYKADIDNDGRPDSVIEMNHASGAGRGCDSSFLVMLDGKRENFSQSLSNKFLLEFEGVQFNLDGKAGTYVGRVSRCYGASYKIFKFMNEVFIEGKNDSPQDPFQKIIKIQGGKTNRICEFECKIELVP